MSMSSEPYLISVCFACFADKQIDKKMLFVQEDWGGELVLLNTHNGLEI